MQTYVLHTLRDETLFIIRAFKKPLTQTMNRECGTSEGLTISLPGL